MILALLYTILDNKRYVQIAKESGGQATPEARLPPCIIGGVAIPVGLSWFVWTNSPSIHWISSVLSGVGFGFGMVLVFLSVLNYLIDTYTIYAASFLAASAFTRSLFGAAFPLFTDQMFQNLGLHWAASVPAFLSVGCIPFPVVLYIYGEKIRKRCRYGNEAEIFMQGAGEENLEQTVAEGSENQDPGGCPFRHDTESRSIPQNS